MRTRTVLFLVFALGVLCGCATKPEPQQEGRPVSEWIRRLHDNDPMNSADAGMALRMMGADAIPFLIKDLADEEGNGRAKAVLAGIGADSVWAYPVALAASGVIRRIWSSSSAKEDAVFVLGQVGEYLCSLKKRNPALDGRGPGVRPDVPDRCASAEQLVRSGLARAAADINSSVRSAAREAMRHAGLTGMRGKGEAKGKAE